MVWGLGHIQVQTGGGWLKFIFVCVWELGGFRIQRGQIGGRIMLHLYLDLSL